MNGNGTLAGLSRAYVLRVLRDYGPLTLGQLKQVAPENGHRIEVEIGRGATIDDYVEVMIRDGAMVKVGDKIRLTRIGQDVLTEISTKYGRALDLAMEQTPTPVQ